MHSLIFPVWATIRFSFFYLYQYIGGHYYGSLFSFLYALRRRNDITKRRFDFFLLHSFSKYYSWFCPLICIKTIEVLIWFTCRLKKPIQKTAGTHKVMSVLWMMILLEYNLNHQVARKKLLMMTEIHKFGLIYIYRIRNGCWISRGSWNCWRSTDNFRR